MKKDEHADELFVRHPANPILKASMWPYRINSVFNPAATRLQDGRTLLLCRCEDMRGISHLCKAVSENGVGGWVIDKAPTLAADPDQYPEELWGLEDPRITYVEELQVYVITYTAYTKGGPGVSMATTKDFETFERYGLVMQPDDKNAALFPSKFNDQFALIHRPVADERPCMWISYSPDLHNWGGHKILLRSRRGPWWDANKIGLGPPPIETPKGWLVLYHGVRQHAAGSLYRIGMALFDKENPEVCIRRSPCWVFRPETPYELAGDVGYVVFPCGWTLGDDGDTLHMYYGAADTCVAMATSSLKKLTNWIMRYGSTFTGVAGQKAEEEHLGND